VYTAVLFGLARLLERKAQNTDDTNTDDTKNDTKGLLFIASILYALGVIGVGVTGVIIPFNIFTCKDTEEVPLWECDQELLDRRLALFSIFLGMLPTVTVSLLIWHKLYIPTMPITTYFSATWFIAVLPIMFPSLKELFDPFDIMKWWFALSSGLWLLGLFLFYLANRVRKETLKWSLNFAALVYFASMFVVTDVFNDGFWFGWIIINVVSFAPLFFVGIVSDQMFLLVLAAVGIFVDVWKIGMSIGNSVPIYFLIFGISGIGLGYFGLILNKHQQKIASEVKNKAEIWLGSFAKDSVDISDTEMAVIETGVCIISKTEED